MAKGQQRSNREVRKPKQDKPDKAKHKTENVSTFKTQIEAAAATKPAKRK